MSQWAAGFLVGFTALAAASPVKAQSTAPPTPTSIFDGIYIGVSTDNISTGNTLSGGRARLRVTPERERAGTFVLRRG